MRNVLEALLDEIRSGRTVVIATVVRSSGSTPRTAGAKMLIGDSLLLRALALKQPPSEGPAVARRQACLHGAQNPSTVQPARRRSLHREACDELQHLVPCLARFVEFDR